MHLGHVQKAGRGMSRNLVKLITLSMFFVIIPNSSFGDKGPRLQSTVNFSPNGKLVYINRLPQDKGPISSPLESNKLAQDEFSLKNYPRSGLYEVASRKFIWSLEDNPLISIHGAEVFDDQVFMIVRGPRASSVNDIAFKIYKMGKLIKSFKIKDFCAIPSNFRYSESHFVWMNNYNLDTNKKEITFEACNKKNRIDVKTGRLFVD
jgi:hypothetical protein